MAKITHIEENRIDFSDGTIIHCDHYQSCCEYNYADFPQLDDLAQNYDFNTSELKFETVDGSGFRFGDSPLTMFFVPCYSRQNGYYTTNLNIYLNGELQNSLKCKEDF